MGGGDGDVGVRFGGESADRGEDGLGAVLVDEVDERLQVAAGGVMSGVVLRFTPGGEEKQFRVPGAAALP